MEREDGEEEGEKGKTVESAVDVLLRECESSRLCRVQSGLAFLEGVVPRSGAGE